MATCKECLHYEACVLNEAYWVKHNADQTCSVFKDKTKYVEQKRGKWIVVDGDGSWRFDRCSICHKRMDYVNYALPDNYCPNCGAKMDGEI